MHLYPLTNQHVSFHYSAILLIKSYILLNTVYQSMNPHHYLPATGGLRPLPGTLEALVWSCNGKYYFFP